MRAATLMVAAVLAAAAPALADDDQIMQIRQMFEPAAAETTAGTVVSYLNADDVNHNLVVVAPGGAETDLGIDKPGETTQISFPTAGVYSVVCHIHPRMKMKMTVRAAAPAASAG